MKTFFTSLLILAFLVLPIVDCVAAYVVYKGHASQTINLVSLLELSVILGLLNAAEGILILFVTSLIIAARRD